MSGILGKEKPLHKFSFFTVQLHLHFFDVIYNLIEEGSNLVQSQLLSVDTVVSFFTSKLWNKRQLQFEIRYCRFHQSNNA